MRWCFCRDGAEAAVAALRFGLLHWHYSLYSHAAFSHCLHAEGAKGFLTLAFLLWSSHTGLLTLAFSNCLLTLPPHIAFSHCLPPRRGQVRYRRSRSSSFTWGRHATSVDQPILATVQAPSSVAPPASSAFASPSALTELHPHGVHGAILKGEKLEGDKEDPWSLHGAVADSSLWVVGSLGSGSIRRSMLESLPEITPFAQDESPLDSLLSLPHPGVPSSCFSPPPSSFPTASSGFSPASSSLPLPPRISLAQQAELGARQCHFCQSALGEGPCTVCHGGLVQCQSLANQYELGWDPNQPPQPLIQHGGPEWDPIPQPQPHMRLRGAPYTHGHGQKVCCWGRG